MTRNRWMDGELNDQHKNTTPYGWTYRELNCWHKNNPKSSQVIFIHKPLQVKVTNAQKLKIHQIH